MPRWGRGGAQSIVECFHPIVTGSAGTRPVEPRIRIWGGNFFEGDVIVLY